MIKPITSGRGAAARAIEPAHDCPLCPRLMAFRQTLRDQHAAWFNSPVPAFGPLAARLLIIGLAPGASGANRTGRPFNGDAAGDFLYPKLLQFGLAVGQYDASGSDELQLRDCRITNAVRCVPPGNRPTAGEIRTCSGFLRAEIAALRRLKVILALGHVAHRSACLSLPSIAVGPFKHGTAHRLGSDQWLVDCYHCSRQNVATGVLTDEMFDAVLQKTKALLG